MSRLYWIQQYLSALPPSGQMWHKAFFKVGPDVPGIPKNTMGPVGIPLKGVPQAPGNKPNPSEEG